jgi:hypothetical protein
MISKHFEVNKPWTEDYLDFWEIVFNRMGFVTSRQGADLLVDVLSAEDEEILKKFIDYDIL